MLYNAKNGRVTVGNTDMDYVSFGKGHRNIIMIPGLGDGLRTVKGTALIMAMTFREYAKDFKVHLFSRKNQLEQGYSTKDMAQDQKIAMEKLGISSAYVMGVSQGGMVAQYLAIHYPEVVEKLVLAVTLSKPNKMVQETVSRWIATANANNYKGLLIDTAEKTYTEKYLKKYRLFYPLLGKIGKPKDFSRFIIQAQACLHHNAYEELYKIECPTLVIGGDSDQIVGKDSSNEIADKIQNSELFLYKGLGHGAYEEANDFNKRIIDFFINN